MATTNKLLFFILAICLLVPSSFALFDNGMPFYYINLASNSSNSTSLNYSQIAANIGNWSADKPSYATLVYIGGLNNLSQSAVQSLINANGNWTLDKTSYSTTAQANSLYYPLNNNLFGYYNVTTLPSQANYYTNITILQASMASEVANRTSLGNYSASASGLYANISAKGTGNITGAGVTGNLSYWSNSTNLISSFVYFNPTNKHVGINKTTPSTTLDVLGLFQVTPYTLPTVATSTGGTILNSIYLEATRGGITTIATSGTGGIGSSIELRAGAGGTAPNAVTSSTGGLGGSINMYSGSGANGSNIGTTDRGGAGGQFVLSSGAGGNTVKGTSTARAGGIFALTSGAGGSSLGSSNALGGNAGTFFVTSGAGGASLNQTGGNGGLISFQSGAGGSTSSTIGGRLGGIGGTMLFQGGAGGSAVTNNTNGNGGTIYLVGGIKGTGAGTAGFEGNINLGNDGTTMVGNIVIGNPITPREKVHQDSGVATATYHKFTANTTTGTTATDGFNIGISATGEAQVRQYENLNLTIWTNNVGQITVANNGTLFFNNYTGAGNQYLCVNSGGQLYRNTTCA